MRITFPAPAPTSASDQATDVVVATAPDSAKKGKRAKSAPLDDYTKSSAPGARLSLLNRLLQSKVGLRVTGGVAGAAILAAPVVGGVHSLMEDPRIASVHAGTQVDGWEAGDLADEEIPREEAKAYAQVGVDELEWMADLRKAAVSPAEISLYIEAGVADIDDMIDLAEHGVSASLMKAYASEGISDLDRVKDLVEIGISPKTERIYQHRASAGYDVDWERWLSAEEISGPELSEYVALDVDRYTAAWLKQNGITPDRIKALGIDPKHFGNFRFEALEQFRGIEKLVQSGVSVQSYLAYRVDGSLPRLSSFADYTARGISPETVQAYAAVRVTDPTDVLFLIDQGVSPEASAPYRTQEVNLNVQSVKKLLDAGISAETYRAYVEKKSMSVEQVIVMVAHGVTPEETSVF